MVTTSHGTDLRQFRACPHLRSRVLAGCRHLDAVLALSRPQKEEIQSLYHLPPDRVSVVGGGYNSHLFFQEKKPPPPPVRLLYAGKLSNAKGIPWFLEAVGRLERHSYHLDMVGGGAGEEYERCRELALALEDNLTLHGSLPQEELAAMMRRAHVLVLPSLFEGLPLIILEAIASGCRVVATELPGTREIAERLQTPCLHLVRAPRLHQVDTPWREDEAAFTSGLHQALAAAIHESGLDPDPDITPLGERIGYFDWDKVFARTQEAYAKALAATS